MKWIVFWFISVAFWFLGVIIFGMPAFFVGLAVFMFFSWLMIYLGLVPKNLFFTFVEEGTCKMVMRGREFERVLIEWKGHTLDDNGDVIEGKETPGFFKQIFGGLRFYGIPFFQNIYKYRQRWTHLHEDGTVKEHDEELDFVFLKEDLYVFEFVSTDTEAIEDINGMPLSVTVAMPMRIVNPYEAMFVARRWLAMISGIVKAATRRFIARYRYREDLLDMRAGRGIENIQVETGMTDEKGKAVTKKGEDLREKFWEELRETLEKEGAEVRRKEEGKKKEEEIRIYGVSIIKRGTDILKIDPSPQYRKLTTLEYEADQKAKREARRWVGTVVQAFAFIKGKEVKDIQEEIDEDEKLQKEFLDYAKDFNIRSMGAERNAYLDIRVQGAEGLEQTILNLVAASKRMPMGGRPLSQPPSRDDERETDSLTDDEFLQKLDEEEWWEEEEGEES